MNDNELNLPSGAITVYRMEDGRGSVRVRIDGDTTWLQQSAIAELYGTTKQNISLHVRKILAEGELDHDAVVKQYLTAAADGKSYLVQHYNLDMVLAIGYRVRSDRGTAFRQWATERLREYLVKGFTLDDERLKGGSGLTDHFDELLARIREIRASEARVYQRIKEIFSLASDYREGEKETQLFFAVMQNKMHFAATGLTAAEIIRKRADAGNVNMGLTSWKGGRVLKRDVGTAKNYLDAPEIDTLNRITVMFLDQAEFRSQRRQDICMRDWDQLLDKFLLDTELHVLPDTGSVSHENAMQWAEEQYDAFAQRRRLTAEDAAEQRYFDDLRTAAQALETTRSSPTQKKKSTSSRTKGRKRK
ncbi:MAG: virulence RhuM family protein [Bacteroidota bacterium]|jgi:hypothetical protein